MGIENSAEGEPGVKIQPFDEKYQESAYEFIREIRREALNDPNADARPRYKDIHGNCQRFDNENFWIAVDQASDKVVGTVGLRFVKDRVGQLIRMGVEKSFRERGVASRLMNELLSFAREKQYEEIYLTTESDQAHRNARAMYENKYGFKTIKPTEIPQKITQEISPFLFVDDNLKKIEEGKTLIYKLHLYYYGQNHRTSAGLR